MKLTQLPEPIRRGIRTGIRKKFSGTIMLILAIFLPAGTLRYPAGWLLLGLFLLNIAYELLVLLPSNPSLFAARSSMQQGTLKWDAILTALTVIVFYLGAVIVAGFDFRNHWSPEFPLWLVLFGTAIWLVGSAITYWAMHANTHFEATVRIQSDRNHQVIDSGPYKIVRHPGYVGALLTYTITPLILSSTWAIIPSALSLIGFVVRTALEDQFLQQELPGYQEYTRKTRYRLFPGIW
ncbi:MAG: isoprenylcysteine carboxylmethyltransferase family protein [Anaerolineae bacterium]|nr:isoprenylcysteine carboxylmethyltransferase family protein [Anaerolineae bacterium]